MDHACRALFNQIQNIISHFMDVLLLCVAIFYSFASESDSIFAQNTIMNKQSRSIRWASVEKSISFHSQKKMNNRYLEKKIVGDFIWHSIAYATLGEKSTTTLWNRIVIKWNIPATRQGGLELIVWTTVLVGQVNNIKYGPESAL